MLLWDTKLWGLLERTGFKLLENIKKKKNIKIIADIEITQTRR